MTSSTSKILTIGTAAPTHQYRQEELASWMAYNLDSEDSQLKRKLGVLYRKTNIRTRYSVLKDFKELNQQNQLFKSNTSIPSVEERLSIYKKEAVPLSIKAIEDCLHNEDLNTVTHLIYVSCTGMTAPGIEIQLKQQLNLSQQVETYAINFIGCYAVFPALKIANTICKANPKAKVLVVATELCTLHFQNRQEDDFILANSLFADGSAAVLIGQQSHNQQKSLAIVEQKQVHLYQGASDMAWNIHSDGFLMQLSSYIPQLVHSKIKTLLQELLNSSNLSNREIRHWAIHPGGRRILEVCQKELKLTDNQLKSSFDTLRNYGNISAPTILFILKSMLEEDSLADKENLFACGFGPGLTLEGALFEINHHG